MEKKMQIDIVHYTVDNNRWSAMYIDGELYERNHFDEMHEWINGFLDCLVWASDHSNIDFDMEEFHIDKPIDGVPDDFSELEIRLDKCE